MELSQHLVNRMRSRWQSFRVMDTSLSRFLSESDTLLIAARQPKVAITLMVEEITERR